MTIDARLKRIEGELGIGGTTRPFILLVGSKGGRTLGEVELRRRIEGAVGRRPKARFIMLLCGTR